MIDVEFNRKSFDDWRAGISKRFRKRLEVAQGEVRRDWQIELFRQQGSHGDGTWADLDPKYKKRKDREHAAGKFPYNSILRRTGAMLDGYVNGIRFGITNTKLVVIMPYPPSNAEDKRINVRAKSHQGEIGQPRGVNGPRKFDVDKFVEIAFNHFNDAMKKAAKNE